ncbi:MAG: hypothetical protein ACRERX_05750 [Pseudomonas sp.]
MADSVTIFVVGFLPAALICLDALERWAPYLDEAHCINRWKRWIQLGSRVLLVMNAVLLALLIYSIAF